MEKLIVFLPIIIFFGIFALLAGGFLAFVLKLILKSKNSSWTGEVTDKVHKQKEDYESHRMEHFYHLVVMKSEGKEMKVGLSQQLWDGFNIGDKIKKDKGKLFPEKIA
jgi:hypothetical protein